LKDEQRELSGRWIRFYVPRILVGCIGFHYNPIKETWAEFVTFPALTPAEGRFSAVFHVMPWKPDPITEDEPHLILLPGSPPSFECSECHQLFLLEPNQNSDHLADDFLEHLRNRHPSLTPATAGFRVRLANQDW
jgi:hypothetical protein